MSDISGLHHVTAIAGDPQENLDFYVGVLGMRLVKRSVNQDVPDTYHLFFADRDGHPGTDITFFPWPNMGPKREGVGLWEEIYLTIPKGTLASWKERLSKHEIEIDDVEVRFGENALPFRDPHGLALALVESDSHEEQEFTAWEESPVPAEMQIRGLGGARMNVREAEQTIAFLTRALGFEHAGYENGWERYVVGKGLSGQRIDLKETPQGRRGAWGVGAVHHVAWRVPDNPTQMRVRAKIAELRRNPTEVIDRFWFQSVYVLEPGGCLCEIATDGPGFSVDEDLDHLGESLVLPHWLEKHRTEIEAALPPLQMPTASKAQNP